MYILHCLLKGDVEGYQHGLVDDIAEKFGLTVTKVENFNTHFTLKYWFDTENIEEVESIVEKFCRTHKKTPVKVGGIDGFSPNTVFININLSDEAKKNFLELIYELKKFPWMNWEWYEGENLHFHSTIAEQCGDKFEDIMSFVKDKEDYFDCWFDNVTILRLKKRVNGVANWEMHKSYLMV